MARRSWVADSSFAGAMVGLVFAIVGFIVLLAAAHRIDENDAGEWALCVGCILRTLALLLLTFGLGIGYMIGRSLG